MVAAVEHTDRLASASHIGVLGDTHGDFEHVLIVAETMRTRGVSVLLVLGDFGFIWPQRGWPATLDALSRRLSAKGQTLYFIDGNHENFDALYRFPVAEDGVRWVRPNIGHLPRGYRTTLASGRTLAALGGANSVDAHHRVIGRSLWAQESITADDLAVLGHAPADILVGHDAPLYVPALDRHLAATDHYWPTSSLAYSRDGRQMFHRGFLQVRPQLYLGGHYHLHVDQTLVYTSADLAFTTRVVILDKNGNATTTSQAILDVGSLELQFLTRNGASPQ